MAPNGQLLPWLKNQQSDLVTAELTEKLIPFTTNIHYWTVIHHMSMDTLPTLNIKIIIT